MSTTPARPTETAEIREALPYVLMKRGLYWRPNGQGYTGVLAEAGRYSREDALAWDDHRDGTSAHLATECDEFSPACWPETQIKMMRAERDAALAQVAQITTDRAAAGVRIAALEGALRGVLAAWDKLPGDRLYSSKTIQIWMVDDLAPAFQPARTALTEGAPHADPA